MAGRANHRALLGCALLCAAAFPCAGVTFAGVPEDQPSSVAAASNFPIASDARLAGDARQTRFVLDLDKTIQFRAFALAVEGSERRWNPHIRRFLRCAGRLNATQPGVLAVSSLYIRGMRPACKDARQASPLSHTQPYSPLLH